MGRTLRILTWNLGEAEEPALANMVATLTKADADFVFLNEAMLDDGIFTNGRYGGHQPRLLAERCGYPWVEWSVLGGLDKGGFKCVALLSRHPLSNANPQPDIKDMNGWPWSGRLPGGNYRALEVQANVAGQIWFLYTLRFSAHEEPNFIRGCQLLRDRILELPAGTPVIAAGDFNGEAHLEGRWRRGPGPEKGDDRLLLQLHPAQVDLVRRTGLQSVTSGLEPKKDRVADQDPERHLPPYIRATDLILYRGPLEQLAVFEDKANIGGEAHPFVFAELGPPGSRVAQAQGAMAAITGLLEPKAFIKPKPKPRPRPRPR